MENEINGMIKSLEEFITVCNSEKWHTFNKKSLNEMQELVIGMLQSLRDYIIDLREISNDFSHQAEKALDLSKFTISHERTMCGLINWFGEILTSGESIENIKQALWDRKMELIGNKPTS